MWQLGHFNFVGYMYNLANIMVKIRSCLISITDSVHLRPQWFTVNSGCHIYTINMEWHLTNSCIYFGHHTFCRRTSEQRRARLLFVSASRNQVFSLPSDWITYHSGPFQCSFFCSSWLIDSGLLLTDWLLFPFLKIIIIITKHLTLTHARHYS